MSGFVSELKQRKVFQSAVIYLVAAWAAVEVSATVLPLLGLGEWAPRLVLALAAAGFPVTLWGAWLFDLRPKAAPDGDEARVDRSVRLGQAALIGAATVIGLTIPTYLALGSATAEDVSLTEPATPAATSDVDRRHTVAVLPFREPDGESGEAYFGEGIADEIVMSLARLDRIRVLSQAAAARLLETGRTPLEIGDDLGAGFILEGTVWREAGRIRIRAALTNTETFEVAWSEDIEQQLTVENLFDTQRRVAAAVARELRLELVDPVAVTAPPTENLDAFEHYLEGNAALIRRTPVSVGRAIASYRRATALDSGFVSALAREAYASALFIDWEWTYPGTNPADLLSRAQSLAARALQRDSASAEAWLATAYVRLMADRDRPGRSLPAFERALALNRGDAEAFHQYGQTLMALGRDAEALSAYHAALTLDPLRAMTMVPMCAIHLRRGDLREARRWADSAVASGPDVPYAWAIRADLLNGLGEFELARRDAERALEIDPSYGIPARATLATAFRGLGDTDAAEAELRRAMLELADAEAPGQTDALFLGSALLAQGRTAEALDLVESATPRSAWLWFYLRHPNFDPIRDEPRFQRVLEESRPER